MFRLLGRWLQAGLGATEPANTANFGALTNLHPLQLHRYLEEAWAFGGFISWPTTGAPVRDSLYLGNPSLFGDYQMPAGLTATIPSGITLGGGFTPGGIPPGLSPSNPMPWEHLIYAYAIENTGLLRVFRRVLELYATGETLETPTDDTRKWLRSTEELFFRDPPAFHISSLTSFARADLEASRRNAYWRMFGMDLNHGLPDGRPYPYLKAPAANTAFVPAWEAFLREVWQGYINARNTSGENSTDPEAVANLADTLAKMLRVRRNGGNLGREEFFFVSMMSWFHVALEDNTPIVRDLKAEAGNAAERLRKIGERVGVPAHPKSRNFFDLAEPASTLLRFIELEKFSDLVNAPVLYNNQVGNTIREDALIVINHWSIATGRDLKLRRPKEAVPVRRPAMIRSGPMREPANTASNGR